MSTFQFTGKMASVVKESSCDVFVNLSDQLGGLVLKQERSIVVVVPLRSIIEDQLLSNDFGLEAVPFEKIPKLLKDIGANKCNVIFASAEQAWLAEFTAGCLNMISTTAF